MTSLANDLKDGNTDAALQKIKQAGGKDVAPFVEAAEDALKKAKNKAGDVDWRGVVESVQDKVGAEWKGVIDVSSHP
jgi:flavin-binding protein dodecin